MSCQLTAKSGSAGNELGSRLSVSRYHRLDGAARESLLDNLRIEPTPGATTLVIFGASGDLTRRKLLPALYSLSRGQRLPARFAVVGVARSEMSDEQFRQQFQDSLREFAKVDARSDEVVRSLAGADVFRLGRDGRSELYERLAERLRGDRRRRVLYYLAIPPTVYGTVVEGLERGRAWPARPSPAGGG